MTKTETREILHNLQNIINDAIDKLAAKRISDPTYENRYVVRKVEKALYNIHMAQEKIDNVG